MHSKDRMKTPLSVSEDALDKIMHSDFQANEPEKTESHFVSSKIRRNSIIKKPAPVDISVDTKTEKHPLVI